MHPDKCGSEIIFTGAGKLYLSDREFKNVQRKYFILINIKAEKYTIL